MPLKREPLPTIQRPVKMLKMGIETQDFEEPVDEISDNPTYSQFVHQEDEPGDFEENDPSLGIRTDTISLLMKIEQLQAQLKYERRCRILAERELRELKEMNNLMHQMRHTANELKVTLDHVRRGNEVAATSQSNDGESISYISEPDKAVTSPPQHDSEEDDTFLYLAEGLRVPRNLYDRIAAITDYKKYTSALLMMLFDRETLATHSLQGRRTNVTGEDCQKPQLPPDVLGSIIDHVGMKFGVDISQIKTAIRTKLNNEDKLLKRRMGIVKSDSIVKSENKVMDFDP